MSLFFVDSGCDIALEQIKNMGVECINLPYVLEDSTLSFSENFDFAKFYSKCKKGLLVKDKSLTKQEYIDIFEPAFKSGDDIVYVHASSKLVGTKPLFDARDMLQKKYPERKMLLLDSRNFSLGQGVLSFELAKLYRNGATLTEIEERYYTLEQEIAMFMVLDSVEALVSRGVDLDGVVLGTALNVKPIVTCDLDGNVRVIDKVSGKKRGVSKLIDIIRMYGQNVVDYPIGVFSAGDEQSANLLCEKIKEYFGTDVELIDSSVTPSNVAICGSGAVGIVFHIHKKVH